MVSGLFALSAQDLPTPDEDFAKALNQTGCRRDECSGCDGHICKTGDFQMIRNTILALVAGAALLSAAAPASAGYYGYGYGYRSYAPSYSYGYSYSYTPSYSYGYRSYGY
jgi:hypothetical protein